MRVLLVNTNRLRAPQPILPLGMCLVAEAAESAGHAVRLLDLCPERLPRAALRQAVLGFEPEVIGLSIRNLDNSDAWAPKCYTDDVRELVGEIRRLTHAPVVLGGSGASIAPDPIAEDIGADYVVAGEGESRFPDLLSSLATGQSPDLPRIIRATSQPEGTQIIPGALPIRAMGKLDLNWYASYGASVPIQTKRGCSGECIYCTYPAIEGTACRAKPPIQVAEEVERAQSLKVFRSAEFVDSVFNMPTEYASELCNELARRGNSFPLLASSINPAQATAALLRLMARAGFVGFTASLESASDVVLGRMRKGFTSMDVHEIVRAAKLTSMARMWTFLLGGPGETEQTLAETLGFIRRYLMHGDTVFLACGVRIYPGTELERIARAEGIIGDGENLLRPTFYFSPEVGREGLMQIVRSARLPGNTVYLSDMSSTYLPLLERVHAMLRLNLPSWRYSRFLRRVCGDHQQHLG